MKNIWKKISITILLLISVGCNYQQAEETLKNPTTSSPTVKNPTTPPQEESTANFSELKKIEKAIHQQVNEYRRSQNLPPLTLDSAISKQARIHSQDMANSKKISHKGFKGRVEAIAQTISYRSAAENVATNYGYSEPAKQAVSGWIKSPGHQENMVGDFDLTGVGVIKTPEGQYYFTQIFIRPR